MREILRPFSYLKIKHPAKKTFDWIVPVILSLIVTVVIAVLAPDGILYGKSGLVKEVLGLVEILPGFYVAALAAIATFNRRDIDKLMPKPEPMLSVRSGGHDVQIGLTRRRFLSMLFAFLTAESLMVAIASIGLVTFGVGLNEVVSDACLITKHLVLGLYLFMVFQMLVATFLGLYYLGDKLHQPDV